MANAKGASGIGSATFGVAVLIVEYWFPHAEPWLTGSLLILFAVLLTVFVTLLLVGWSSREESKPGMVISGNQNVHIHQYSDQIQSELSALDPSIVNSTPSVVVAQPDAGALPPIHGVATALEQTDTMASTGHIFPPTVRAISPLYVGQIIISASQLSEGSLEIAIRAFNGSRETIALDSVQGAISAGIGNANGTGLPTPTIRPEFPGPEIPPGAEFMVVLDQSIPEPQLQHYLTALDDPDVYIALDFRALQVLVRASDAADLTAPLPLWDGVTIRRRDDIFTGRNTIVTLSGLSLTLNASGTLTDANDGK